MAAPNNTDEDSDSDSDDVGALIYREVQLRKAEAAAAAAARKISHIAIEKQARAGDEESLPSLERQRKGAMKRRKQESSSSNGDDCPRNKVKVARKKRRYACQLMDALT